MRKLIFLDVDGVINTDFSRPINEQSPNDSHLQQLKRIVDTVGAEIVLSSNWRHYDLHKGLLKTAFEYWGIPLWVGETPDIQGPRFVEIMAWLEDNAPHDRVFVILDDDSDACIPGAFVHTETRVGLTSALADKAIEILNADSQLAAKVRVEAKRKHRKQLTDLCVRIREANDEHASGYTLVDQDDLEAIRWVMHVENGFSRLKDE